MPNKPQSALHVVVPEKPVDADREVIMKVLGAFNRGKAGDARWRRVAVTLVDADGQRAGGLWGECLYDWLFVEMLAVPEMHRGGGYGQALMAEAERIANEHGCIGIWLDTFAFQARGFYEKLGFELFGTLDDHPRGRQRFFLKKRLR